MSGALLTVAGLTFPSLSEMVTDFTLRNVLLGAIVLGVASGVLGSFALLRRQSLLGDALSHAALPGICVGFLVAGARETVPILGGALLAAILAALAMLAITRNSRLKEDAALGIVLSVFFALGTVLLTYIQHQNDAGQAGLETFLFGQAAAILPSDVAAMGVICLIALVMVLAFWKEVKATTFDPEFARSIGLPVRFVDVSLTALVACAVVVGLQMVGVVLMSAMLIAPAAAARQWTDKLGLMVILSAAFAVVSGTFGAVVSASGRGLPTGPLIVLTASGLVALSITLAPNRGLAWRAVRNAASRKALRRDTILVNILLLTRRHDNPNYPVELGMLNALLGARPQRSLHRMVGEGLLEQTVHMEEEGDHFVLTLTGRAFAEGALATLERAEDNV